MAARNPREAGLFGVSPQTFNSPTVDKFNREAAASIAELQEKVAKGLPAEPKEGEAPASVDLFGRRAAGYGWPFVTAAVSVGAGGRQEIPGSGFGLGTLYKGEQIDVELMLGAVTSTGAAYLQIVAMGTTGQGSPMRVIGEAKPYLPTATGAAGFSAGLVGTADGQYENVEFHFYAGADSGSIAIPANAAMLQRFAVHTPIRKAAS